MGVESFLNQPFDQGLLQRARETGRSVSLPRVLGNMIMAEGAQELRRLGKVEGGSVLTIGSVNFSQDERLEATMSVGGIILGATIAIIEEAMVEKQIDLLSFTSEINNALSGTPIPTLPAAKEEKVVLTNEQRDQMLKAAAADRTLAVFFENSNRLLPVAFKDYLLGSWPNVLDFINQFLIPRYKSRVQSLLGIADK